MIRSEKQLLNIFLSFTFLSILMVSILLFTAVISSVVFKSILLGGLVSLLNFVIGFLLLKFSANKSEKIFLLMLWGGLLFRLIFGLTLILITLIFLEINTYGFIFSILFFYVFYLLIEIFYLNFGRKSQFGSK